MLDASVTLAPLLQARTLSQYLFNLDSPRWHRSYARTLKRLIGQSPKVCLSIHPLTLRVHVRNNWVLGVAILVIVVQVVGMYMISMYLDPYDKP